jgi:predicted metal-dependent peptidase
MLTKQRITDAVEKWYVVDPLFFAVWTTHELCVNPNIQSIRVGQGKVEYNPTFIDRLDKETLYQVLRFEVMRIVLKHPYLRRKEIQKVAYAASNITVQEYLKTPLDFPNAKQVFQSDEYNNKYFEFYYYELLNSAEDNEVMEQAMGGTGQSGDSNQDTGSKDDSQEAEEEEQSPKAGQDDDSQEAEEEEQSPKAPTEQIGSHAGAWEPASAGQAPTEQIGSHAGAWEPDSAGQDDKSAEREQYFVAEISGMENTELWDTNEYYSNQVNDKIESALENSSWGSLPSLIQELILATLKPKINYRQILRSFRASIISVNRVLTRMKPSRRYGFLYMGSRRDFCTKLLFAVDVSGSVGSQDIRQAFSIINQLFKYGIERVDVIQFDAEIKGNPLSLKKAKYKVEVIGRGGTDFQPVVDYIDTNTGYDGLIIFTDGFAPVPNAPKNRRTKILWLFNNEANYLGLEKDLRPIGGSAFIKDN